MSRPAFDPDALAGWWVADDGKAVLLERHGDGLVVTVCPAVGAPPYRSARLVLRRRRIRRLPGEWVVDGQDRTCLQIEAGIRGAGPTYRLHPALETPDGDLHPAPPGTAADQLVLVPATGVGLYDEYEDDLGVPWAEPLMPLRRAAP